jgi:hypothetical protein
VPNLGIQRVNLILSNPKSLPGISQLVVLGSWLLYRINLTILFVFVLNDCPLGTQDSGIEPVG